MSWKILSLVLNKVHKPTYINGKLIDHVYVRKSLVNVFEIDFIKYSLSFSDHDALKIRLKLKVNEWWMDVLGNQGFWESLPCLLYTSDAADE